jgi:hypothetical protein
MAYTVPKTGISETGVTGFLDCLTMIQKGDEKQQNEYSAKLGAIFKEAKKAIEAGDKFIITDAPDDERIHRTVISTIDVLKELKDNHGDFLMGFEHGESGQNMPYYLGYDCGLAKRRKVRGGK